jgi:simple sugar transport system ATP-binding protein
MSGTALLQVRNVSKSFPGVLANDDVSFEVGKGEIHALLGENGAGKSTLVKMIYGVMRPDSGDMLLDGAPYAPSRPSDARARGIGMVFQHFTLFEALSVAENVVLGTEGRIDRARLDQKIVEVAEAYGFRLDPGRLVGTLSVGERQRIEIIRCLLQNPRLIIMDEPTSVLTPQEVEILFKTLRRIRDEGCSILYISHKLEEIRALCDKATILRGGKVVASCNPKQETAKSLAEMMIGTELRPAIRGKTALGDIRLQLDGLTLASDHQFGVDLTDITAAVCAGEILGIAGVAGNGQVELMEALIGERPVAPEMVRVDGKPVGDLGPQERRRLGMAFIPEERLGHAAVPGMSLAENTVLSGLTAKQLVRGGFIDRHGTAAFAREIVEAFKVKTAGIEHAAKSLSGGNLQKFVVGREVLLKPGVLVASQPTWGVDAGAAAAIHQFLIDLAGEGAAIVVISQDLDELMAISTSIAVIAGGALSTSRLVGEISIEEIGRAMGGRNQGGAGHAQA